MHTKILLVKDLMAWLYPLKRKPKRTRKEGIISKHMRKKHQKTATDTASVKMDFSSDNLDVND